MSSFGFGPSKKGRTADASMMTRNVRITSQGAADATYSSNLKKNPFRLSTAILNGYQYGGETIADTNNGVLAQSPYVYRQQALVDLFSPFIGGTWKLNGDTTYVQPPNMFNLTRNNNAGYDSSVFNNNAIINVAFPFTVTETFRTSADSLSSPTDGFCLAFSTLSGFLGAGGSALGMLEAGSPLVIKAVGVAVGPLASYTQLATNVNLNAYPSSSVNLGQIALDIANVNTYVKVSVNYDGSNRLSWTVSEGNYIIDSSYSGINLQSLLGSSNAFLGATAGSGSRYQTVDLWGATYQTYA